MIERYTLNTYQYKIPGFFLLLFDVDRAIELVEAGETNGIVEIDRDEMIAIALRNDWRAERVAAVDHRIPGIAAPVYIPEIQRIVFILIDGTHRCVAALQAGKPFYARILNSRAADQIMIMSDRRLMPWLSDRDEFAKLGALDRRKAP